MELQKLAFWPGPVVTALADHWITDVEQVVAIAAQGTEALGGLADAAGIDVESMLDLVNKSRYAIGREMRESMEKPVDPNEFGRGVLPPE